MKRTQLWSTTAAQAIHGNANLRFVYPSEGFPLYCDCAVILRESARYELAHDFLEFLLHPDVAAANAGVAETATANGAAQVARDPVLFPPDEIYRRPATSYAAQFIGHTNLLRAEVSGGIAKSGSLSWPTKAADGNALFSLRPECIHLALNSADAARFCARVLDHAFYGASELVRVETTDAQELTVRTSQRGVLRGEVELEFSSDDAVLVRESK